MCVSVGFLQIRSHLLNISNYVLCLYVCGIIVLGCSSHIVRDVVFVVDTSSNVGSSKFQLVRELIENIIINLKINSPETLFGLITFDDFAQFQFGLTHHTDLHTLLLAINPGLSYYDNSSISNVASGLHLLLSGSEQGGPLHLRNEASKVAIVIIHQYFDYDLLQSAANSLHARNIFDVYAIGISSISTNVLHLIASDQSFIFISTDKQLEENVIEQLCSCKICTYSHTVTYLTNIYVGELFAKCKCIPSNEQSQ